MDDVRRWPNSALIFIPALPFTYSVKEEMQNFNQFPKKKKRKKERKKRSSPISALFCG